MSLIVDWRVNAIVVFGAVRIEALVMVKFALILANMDEEVKGRRW